MLNRERSLFAKQGHAVLYSAQPISFVAELPYKVTYKSSGETDYISFHQAATYNAIKWTSDKSPCIFVVKIHRDANTTWSTWCAIDYEIDRGFRWIRYSSDGTGETEEAVGKAYVIQPEPFATTEEDAATQIIQRLARNTLDHRSANISGWCPDIVSEYEKKREQSPKIYLAIAAAIALIGIVAMCQRSS
jgi:hypothetical protein